MPPPKVNRLGGHQHGWKTTAFLWFLSGLVCGFFSTWLLCTQHWLWGQ
jgi:hypothetical protein